MKKVNIIIDIRPELRHYHGVEGYYILHDNWVTESIEVLCDEQGKKYVVEDFKSIELATAVNTDIPPQIPAPRLTWLKHSAVKITGDFEIGDGLYCQ